MFTKLISFVCVLTLALAAATYAADEPLVIGNWENNFDDWQEMWGGNLWGFSTTGGTLDGLGGFGDGTPMALKLLAPAGDWSSAIYLKMQGHTNEDVDIFGTATDRRAWWLENCQYNMLEVDVTRLANEWVVSDVDPRSELVALLNWGGWDSEGNSAADDPAGWTLWNMIGTANSAWDGLADATRTVMWDLTAAKAEAVAAYNAGYNVDAYCEIVLLPWNAGYTGVAANAGMLAYYLDNARLVPEPATIALLGLGALSLIRRKR